MVTSQLSAEAVITGWLIGHTTHFRASDKLYGTWWNEGESTWRKTCAIFIYQKSHTKYKEIEHMPPQLEDSI
jgi:hypothetical protein